MDKRQIVLVVDDSEDFRLLADVILSKAGYAVATAADGIEAVDYLNAHAAPAVILLDLKMPRMGGLEFLERQGLRLTRDRVPVVMFSSESHSFLKKACGSCSGVVGVVGKPFARGDLTAKVAAALAGSEGYR